MQLYSDHPRPAPPAPDRQVSSWAGRSSAADVANEPARKGSNVYEINQWLWQFGRERGKPCLGGLSVAETEERRIAVAKDGSQRAVATLARRQHKAPMAAGPPGGIEQDIHRKSLIQIFVI